MSDTLRELEQSHEARFKLSEEMRFKAQARRNRLLGQWAAERMGLAPEAAAEYARGLVALNLERPGIDHLVARVAQDLGAAGVTVTDSEIVAALNRCHAEAVSSLSEGYPNPLGTDHVRVGG
ncbi:MAG: DUF1476 domain-containing protein [Rhodospirillales bacterium]|nr:MAG: DUF1476 domain-containing protein [Rhodospirillales bacterium]